MSGNGRGGMPTKAMLLAAGKGTRLRPVTATMPKCMVPVRGKPMLQHNIEWLRRFGVTELVINLSYLPDAVVDHFGDGSEWGVSITYSREEELLGTAGGVKKVASFFENEPFFVWYGDNLSTVNLAQLYDFHARNRATATITLFYREDVTASGIVGLDDAGRITRFLEKPRPEQVFSHWVNAGVYVLEPSVLDVIPAVGESDFGKEILPDLLKAGEPLYGYRLSGDEGLWWIDTLADLERLQKEFAYKE